MTSRVLIEGPVPSDYPQFQNEGNEATSREVLRVYDLWCAEVPESAQPSAYRPGSRPVRVALSGRRTLDTLDDLAEQMALMVDYCLCVWAAGRTHPGTKVSLILHRWDNHEHELQWWFSNEATDLGRDSLLRDYRKFSEYLT